MNAVAEPMRREMERSFISKVSYVAKMVSMVGDPKEAISTL